MKKYADIIASILLLVGLALLTGYGVAKGTLATPRPVTHVVTRNVTRTVLATPKACAALPTDHRAAINGDRAAQWQEALDIASCSGVPLAQVVGADRALGA